MPGFSRQVKETASHTSVTLDSYVVINSILKSKGRGISYRQSANIDDKSDETVTWGSVVSGSLVEEDWLKVGPRCYLPVKINGCYVLLQQNEKGGHQDFARKRRHGANVHWRLEVSGCQESQLGPTFFGTYAQVGDHHDRPAYRILGGNAAIYFWDERDGEELAGWWFGRTVGSPHCLALNRSSASTPPLSGWQVPPGQQSDGSIILRRAETKCITVHGHQDPTYNGKYELQAQALNRHPWFKKFAPVRILYCFTEGESGEARWNLDTREQRQEAQRGIHDWSAGGYFAGGFIPFGTARWHNPSMKLTLLCDLADSELEGGARAERTQARWRPIAPWEPWFSEQIGGPVYRNRASGEWAQELPATGINSELLERLSNLRPEECEGICEPDMDMSPSPRKAVPKQTADPPLKPGEPYVVGSHGAERPYVAKVHAEPQEDSIVYTGLQAGDFIELHAWDSSLTWRRVWHALGRGTAIGVWGFVKFFDSERRAHFRPKDWWCSAPLPLGLLGMAVWENDGPLVDQLITEQADVNTRAAIGEGEASLVTPLLLAGWRGHGDLCIQLLQAGAGPLTVETGLRSPRLKGPVGSLLRALSGEEIESLREVDKAVDALRPDAWKAANDLLDRIAEEKHQQRQGEAPEGKEPREAAEGAAQPREQGHRAAVDEKAQWEKPKQTEAREKEEQQQGKEQVEAEQGEEGEKERHLEPEEGEKEKGHEEQQRGTNVQMHPGLSTAESGAKVEARQGAKTRMLERRNRRMEALAESPDWAAIAAPALAPARAKA